MSKGMLPPKLQDLSLWTSTGTQADSNEVWSIGVSIKNSLPWSIVLSYLFSASDEEFPLYLRKVTGSDADIEDIKKKKNLSLDKIDSEQIRQKLNSFSPSKDNDRFFHQSKELSEIFIIFDLRLNRFANSLRKKTTEWNDDFKLNAASKLLECVIEVYFPEELENKRIVTYPKQPHNYQSKITIFQYENQQHGTKKESITMFHFGMKAKRGCSPPLDSQSRINTPTLDVQSHINNPTLVSSSKDRGVRMPPPKLQDLASWTSGRNTTREGNSNKVWEISVPITNSLPWSLVLSYLFSAGGEEFSGFLRKITGSDENIEDIKAKKNLKVNKIEAEVVRQKLKSFNPFKNRHTFFNQCKEVINIVRIFDLRLKRYANSLRQKTTEWNDDFKLNAASKLLECVIEVYFPEELENKRVITYPKTSHDFKSKIIIFQYENRQHGSRKEAINVFHFSMTVEQAHPLKLDALIYFLKKAKIARSRINEIKTLMNNHENQGENFLPTILKNRLCDILPKIYSSPYITLKLSEAGFQTDPMIVHAAEPSPLCYSVLFSTDLTYIGLLYDYASNCRCLFNRSVRRADDDVLDTLKQIMQLMKRDISTLPECRFQQQAKDRASDILKQFILFSEYQLKIATDLKTLTEKQAELEDFSFRKQVIESILSHYTNCFLKKSTELSKMSAKLSDYFDFSEYYRNADDFTYVFFFDNFYRLKLCMGITGEHLFLKIEWIMFLTMLSNIYFSKFDSGIKYRSDYDKQRCEKDYVLQYIPVLYRSTVQNDLSTLLGILKAASNAEGLESKVSALSTDPHALPQVKDRLMVLKLIIHIDAALEVSPRDDGIAAVLAIERALQVIGESILFPKSDIASVRYLLKSRLPDNIQSSLVGIRHKLSHFKGPSAYERLEIEEDLKIFDNLREQLKEIKVLFKIVYFSQFLRIEESMMLHFLKERGDELDVEAQNAFYKQYEFRKMERVKLYESNHNQCIDLLWENAFALIKYCEECKEEWKHTIIGWLKSIETLLQFILKHKSEYDLERYAKDIQNFIEDCKDKELNDFRSDLQFFLTRNLKEHINASVQTELNRKNNQDTAIENFSESLSRKLFSTVEQESIITAVLNAYDEAEEARTKLKDLITDRSCDIKENCKYLEKILIPNKKIEMLREMFEAHTVNENFKVAITYLEKQCVSKESIEESLKNYIKSDTEDSSKNSFDTEDSSKNTTNPYVLTLLKRIVYWRSEIYTSVELTDDILLKLEKYLTRNIHLLIKRIKDLKSILIDEDEEIKETWTWGRSEAIKHHMRFLMRQRYMRDARVRAALDMAFFDCMNILILKKKRWKELYEKSTDLFNGVNLRNLLAHNTNTETIAGLLDKDDFPSAMIEKMLTLIDDSEAIEAMLRLFPKRGGLTEENFKSWILNTDSQEYAKEIKSVNGCKKWEKYLFLYPFARI